MMLCISRRVGESFQIGNATVKVLEIKRGDYGVRLGIDAPRHIQVVRDDAKKTEPRK